MSAISSGKSHTYVSDAHGRGVINGFQRLWTNRQLCDTCLKAQGKVFHVHRCFLASCSEYFYCLFSEDFKESHQSEVDLKGITAIGLEALLAFAYTGKITLDHANFQHVLEAAAHLQFSEVLDFCSIFLKSEITIENCLDFLRMAELYDLSDCKEDTKDFILQHFVPVAESEEFLTISFELLCELLSSDRLHASSELDVFRMAIRWLTAPSYAPERAANARSVLSGIRFGLIDAEHMDTVFSNPLMLGEGCRDILQGALNYHMRLFAQPLIAGQSQIASMRSFVDSVLIMGAGMLNNSLCSHTMAAALDPNGCMSRLDSMFPLKEKRYFAAVAVVNDFVYVIGGQTAMAGDGSHATSTSFRFNPRDGRWLQISSMSVPRTHFALVALPNGLVAIGGKNNRVALKNSETYDFNTNEWKPIADLYNTLFSHAGCAFNGKVYISGGCPGEDFTDDCYVYCPQKNQWSVLYPMNQSRGYHVMMAHNNYIYALAGNSNAGDRHDVVDAERFDVANNTWTVLRSAEQGQSEAPAVKSGDYIYILGGYSWDAHSFQDTIQSYNVESDTWNTLMFGLPEPMTGLVACTVKLPTDLYLKFGHLYLRTDTKSETATDNFYMGTQLQ